ncbi:MAG TPA: toll/interleukin-1 receptor domain-containing protein [Terriglobales bacterium]|jgi:hypothetical protein|nr:toll/interleukin-1 receptor domain-containing protein [Terriglobales bacterium]
MADQSQFEILKQGVLVWNTWRQENPRIIPNLTAIEMTHSDLGGINLDSVDLSDAKLNGAHLGGASLINANLSRADLRKTNLDASELIHASLRGANLCGASLGGTNCHVASLRCATLREANISHTFFRDIAFEGTDFSYSRMRFASFVESDLSSAKGLDTVSHDGPSSIGIDTVFRSGGNIPDVFLRGAGVPEPFISQMKSLVAAMSPIEFYSCFISYSSKDQEFAERLRADLRSKNVRCWFAPEDLKIGDKLRSSFDEAIRVHDKLMVLLSEDSVESQWVEKEVETAFEKERKQNRVVLFPIRLDDAVMNTHQAWAADIRRTRHIGDFKNWKDHDSYKEAFKRLLQSLKAV